MKFFLRANEKTCMRMGSPAREWGDLCANGETVRDAWDTVMTEYAAEETNAPVAQRRLRIWSYAAIALASISSLR